MIEHYDFGEITVDGKNFDSDLIIFPDRINGAWWRKEGHKLQIVDLKEVFEEKPELLVVGSGFSGFMKVAPEVERQIIEKGIDLKVEHTKEACAEFNNNYKRRKTVAALHLTC